MELTSINYNTENILCIYKHICKYIAGFNALGRTFMNCEIYEKTYMTLCVCIIENMCVLHNVLQKNINIEILQNSKYTTKKKNIN